MKKIICLFICMLSAFGANAGVIYDNGGISSGDTGSETTKWVQADDFNIASGGTLTGAGVYIAALGDILSVWDGTLEYFIFSDGGFTPGSLITSGNGVNVSTTDTGISWSGDDNNSWLFEFDFQSSFTALANTDYWLGIHLSNDYNRDNLYWIWQAGIVDGSANSLEGTFDNWVSSTTEKAFYLNGDVYDAGDTISAPAPAGILLLSLGLVGLGCFRKTKASK